MFAFDVRILVTSEYVIDCPSGSVAVTATPDNVASFRIPVPKLPAGVVQVGAEPASSAASNNPCPPSGFVTLTPYGSPATVSAGAVAVNTPLVAQAEAPFGGIKQTGYGREGGSMGIKDYLNIKYTHFGISYE